MSSILEYNPTPALNETINGIGIRNSNAISGGSRAIRQLMADQAAALMNVAVKAAGTYPAARTDYNQFWKASGAITINLASAASLRAGFAAIGFNQTRTDKFFADAAKQGDGTGQ